MLKKTPKFVQIKIPLGAVAPKSYVPDRLTLVNIALTPHQGMALKRALSGLGAEAGLARPADADLILSILDAVASELEAGK